MTITPEAILEIAQVSILLGIFLKLGRFSEAIETLKQNQRDIRAEQNEMRAPILRLVAKEKDE